MSIWYFGGSLSMLKQMNAQYVVSFEPQGAIKEQQQLIQETLSSYFPPASYSTIGLPVNAEIPAEIPRILAMSKFGHSSLQIAESEIRLNTQFDTEFQEDLDTCWLYFKERIDKINELTKSISKDHILFAGIVAQFIDEDVNMPAKFIRKKYFNDTIGADVYDLLARMTYVISDQYYLNILVNNLRADNDRDKEALGISVDINNRYLMNTAKEIKHVDNEVLDGLQRNYVEFINTQIHKITEEG
jgi:hypothetical protein